jgi:hypothetical protein
MGEAGRGARPPLACGAVVMPEFVCAFEITRSFTNEEVAHNPDPEEVMATLVRQVEYALRTVDTMRGNTKFKRLHSTTLEG